MMEGAHWVEYDIGAETLSIGAMPRMMPPPGQDICQMVWRTIRCASLKYRPDEIRNEPLHFYQKKQWPEKIVDSRWRFLNRKPLSITELSFKVSSMAIRKN